jgi:putative Holliday junction resolvase
MRSEEDTSSEHHGAAGNASAGHSAFPIPRSALGRLLALDVGDVRIGLAVCDRDRLMASPHDQYTRRTAEKDAEFFARLVKDEQIVGLVVGLPINMNGTEGPKAVAYRKYGEWLAGVLNLPVAFMDERLTTHAAQGMLMDAGLSRQKRKERLDKLAATLILQAYLDATRS